MKKEMDEYEAQLDKQPNDPVLFTLYGGSYGDHHDLSQEVKLLISKSWIKRPEGRPVSAKDGIQSTGFALKIHSYTVSSRTTYTLKQLAWEKVRLSAVFLLVPQGP